MPGAGVKFVVDTIGPELKSAAERAQDFSVPLRVMGARMILSIDQNFRRRGRRDGVPNSWPPLSPVTIAMRPKGQRGRPRPLVQTGTFRRSTETEVSRTQLIVGSNLSYANDHHQDGNWGASITKRERKDVPAHKRTMWVRTARGEQAKARQGRKAGREPSRTSPAKKRRARREKRTRGARADRVAPLRTRRRGRTVPPSKGLVRRKVQVRAHTQNRTSRIPARPVYVFQPRDLLVWGRLQRNWVIRGVAREGR